MPKNLVIVESPAKARTLAQFLGKDYVVKSSYGHIRDLPKKGLNIDIDKQFQPKYEISADKRKIVAELKKAAAGSEVWLASDEDREGEAIAWHLAHALKLEPTKTKRIVFHEITKSAIETAIKNPRTVDPKLFEAQQARRVLDRLVGYELSPVLWKKVRTGLSAGRVQSVAVRLLVERERAIRDHEAASDFKVTAIFQTAKSEAVPAELDKRLDSMATAERWLDKVRDATYKVQSVDKKPAQRQPSAPFTTSTLQQAASSRLGFSVRQTMVLAQRLYEAGHITYMRTDSTNLSSFALDSLGQYIDKTYGAKYHQRRQYKTKNKSAQEAHEAIRPTDVRQLSAGQDDQQHKLYKLIWQRAVASQMSPAAVERTEVKIDISTQPESFVAKGEILQFDGFMKVYGTPKDDTILPPVKVGESLATEAMQATETYGRSPARYTEASLVRKLEELGIGRPSTYAPTISTIQSRGYVEKGDSPGTETEITELRLANGKITTHKNQLTIGADRGKLLPTGIAEVVTDFLVKYFPKIVDYQFTARVEEDFDAIAAGQLAWTEMMEFFYRDFHPLVEQSEDLSRNEVSQARELGNDPQSGEPIYARFGRYGPMLLKGYTEQEDKKPTFAPMPAGATIDTVTLDQALAMFQLPRTVGETAAGETIKANIGRFGPYIQVDKTFVSIKPHDPLTISLAEAREFYQDKLNKDAAKHIKEFSSGLKILKGPYGPYITDGKKNARISKELDPIKLTEAEAKKILAAAPTKKRRFAKGRRSKTKK